MPETKNTIIIKRKRGAHTSGVQKPTKERRRFTENEIHIALARKTKNHPICWGATRGILKKITMSVNSINPKKIFINLSTASVAAYVPKIDSGLRRRFIIPPL